MHESLQPITTKKELWAFYTYNIALSAVGQFGLVIAFPLILDGLASGMGHLEGTEIPCSEGAALKANGTMPNLPPCVFSMGSIPMNTDSFTNYVISFSVLIQAFLYISIASFGDYGNWRKKFMIIFGILGFLSCIAMPAAFESNLYWLAGLFVVLVNVFQGTSYVFLDGYFPILVRNDPAVREGTLSFDERANQVQTFGNVSGFATGVLFEAIAGLVLYFLSQSVMTLQILVASTGIWWFLLGIYTVIYLKERPGPPLPSGYSNYIFFSWSTVVHTVSKWKRIPNTFLYLLSFFMYSDAMHTLSQVAILFCQNKLGLGPSEILLVAILFPISALFGNIALLYLQRCLKITTKTMLLSCLLFMTLVPFYALLGAFNDKIGLVHKWEAYMISIFGFVFGAIQSFGKVMYAELIPEGCESEFFALAAIADRGSSWIGPLMVGGISQVTHDIRYGMVSIAVLFIIALPLIYFVDVEKGVVDAELYAQELKDLEHLVATVNSPSDEPVDLELNLGDTIRIKVPTPVVKLD